MELPQRHREHGVRILVLRRFHSLSRGRPLRRPPGRSFALIAGTVAGRLRRLHLFRHLRFHRIKIETRAPLHRWIFEEDLKFLANHLLNKDKTPKLELEPIEVLLPSYFRTGVRPARAFERIQSQVSNVRYVGVSLFTQPPRGLINETELVVVNPHGADRAFAEVEDFVTGRRTFASNGRHLVVPIQVVLVSAGRSGKPKAGRWSVKA
jgi:hypothetical protein